MELPPLFESCVTSLRLYRRPTLVHVFVNGKKSKGKFAATRRARKAKTPCLQCWFCSKLLRRQPHPHPSWPAPLGSLPRNQLSLSASTPEFQTVSVSISASSWFARACVGIHWQDVSLRYQKSLRKWFWGSLGMLKKFLFKLMAMASSFYVTSF